MKYDKNSSENSDDLWYLCTVAFLPILSVPKKVFFLTSVAKNISYRKRKRTLYQSNPTQ